MTPIEIIRKEFMMARAATLEAVITSENKYAPKHATLSYERVPNELHITTDRPCILRFHTPNDLHRDILLVEHEATLALPESFVEVDYEVYVLAEPPKSASEPPPIRPGTPPPPPPTKARNLITKN